jgi:hypothetical protein
MALQQRIKNTDEHTQTLMTQPLTSTECLASGTLGLALSSPPRHHTHIESCAGLQAPLTLCCIPAAGSSALCAQWWMAVMSEVGSVLHTG